MDTELGLRFQRWGNEQQLYASSDRLWKEGKCVLYEAGRFILVHEINDRHLYYFPEFYPLTIVDLTEDEQQAAMVWMFRD